MQLRVSGTSRTRWGIPMNPDDEVMMARCLTCDGAFDIMSSYDGIHCNSCTEEYEKIRDYEDEA